MYVSNLHSLVTTGLKNTILRHVLNLSITISLQFHKLLLLLLFFIGVYEQNGYSMLFLQLFNLHDTGNIMRIL